MASGYEMDLSWKGGLSDPRTARLGSSRIKYVEGLLLSRIAFPSGLSMLAGSESVQVSVEHRPLCQNAGACIHCEQLLGATIGAAIRIAIWPIVWCRVLAYCRVYLHTQAAMSEFVHALHNDNYIFRPQAVLPSCHSSKA